MALSKELREWGLHVNLPKCQVYASPYSGDLGEFQLNGTRIERDDHLQVMGIPFRVGVTPKKALAPLLARVKSKFWAMTRTSYARGLHWQADYGHYTECWAMRPSA